MTTPQLQQQMDPTAMLSQILVEQGRQGIQLAVISEQLKTVVSGASDHEGRIRSLEKWRYGLPLSGLLAAASIALSIYEAMHK